MYLAPEVPHVKFVICRGNILLHWIYDPSVIEMIFCALECKVSHWIDLTVPDLVVAGCTCLVIAILATYRATIRWTLDLIAVGDKVLEQKRFLGANLTWRTL